MAKLVPLPIYFAIRLKGTYKYLPAAKNAHSFHVPTDTSIAIPRLFKTDRAAKNALTCWAKGEWHAEFHTTSYGEDDRYYSPKDPASGPRDKDTMEVVKVELRIR
jgi:hypothetical protein